MKHIEALIEDDETLNTLLQRLDHALGRNDEDGTVADEVNGG